MLPLAGLVAAAVCVIGAVAYWSLRAGGVHDDEDTFESGAHGEPRVRPAPANRTASANRAAPGNRAATASRPATAATGPHAAIDASAGTWTPKEPAAGRIPPTPPDGFRTERQGDAVAKSRPRIGLADRVGWRRRGDVDAEMWPEEGFGGVSDEQFWDDLASDKPLATTARTAQAEGAPLPSPASGPRSQPGKTGPSPAAGQTGQPGQTGQTGQRQPERRPAGRMEPQPYSDSSTQAFPAATSQSAQSNTQAFKITGTPPAHTTGPQPIRPGTQPQPVQQPLAPQHASQPIPVRAPTSPQPFPAAQPGPAGQPNRISTQSQPQQALPAPHPQPGAHALPAAQSMQPAPYTRPAQGRGRHSAGEDPLTSSAYSLRSNADVDGRSYQASRRARDMPRDQYEAAISQETQTFSAVDGDPSSHQSGTPPYGYELPPAAGRQAPDQYRQNGYSGTGGYPRPYTQPGQSAQGPQTPPYGENYGYDARSGRPAPTGRGGHERDRDYGRPAVKGGRPEQTRGDRPGYATDQRPGYPDGRPGYPAERPAYTYPGPHDSRGTDRRG